MVSNLELLDDHPSEEEETHVGNGLERSATLGTELSGSGFGSTAAAKLDSYYSWGSGSEVN